jgi:hypothetical protein
VPPKSCAARHSCPAHVARFALARHAWDEPLGSITAASSGGRYRLVTPCIGEPLQLDDAQQHFTRWWEGVEARP